jgi:hypothetical protein
MFINENEQGMLWTAQEAIFFAAFALSPWHHVCW